MKNKKKIFSFGFFKAVICSLVGLTFYIIGKKAVPFPEKWMNANKGHSLFFMGIMGHLTVSWITNIVFLFFDQEKYDQRKVKKWKDRLSKLFVFGYFIWFGVNSYWDSVKGNPSYLALLILILLIINCLIDALIQWMNKYGVCSGFSLLLFVEFLPTKWISETLFPNVQNNWQGKASWNGGGLLQQPWFCVLLLLAITAFFLWIINLKWEAPVESNTTYFADNPLVKKHRFKLGFRMNFSFMALYQLAQFLTWIFVGSKLFLGAWGGGKYPSPHSNWFIRKFQDAQWIGSNPENPQNLNRQSIVWQGEGNKGAGESFFLLNNKKRLFGNLFQWIGGWKGVIILALLTLILVRWLAVWLHIRKFTLKTKDISDKLKRRGIFVNCLSPGKWTRELLKKIVNRLVFFWVCVILLFNIAFDQIFANLEKKQVNEMVANPYGAERPGQFFPRFLDWFGSIGIGIDLYRQIKTKYKYSQRN